jgi:hypothetical protein
VSEQFMKAEDFQIGATVRAGKGYSCLDEGSIHLVEADGNGTPHIRCQYKGQNHKGYHYPLEPRALALRDDGRLAELYLVTPPRT